MKEKEKAEISCLPNGDHGTVKKACELGIRLIAPHKVCVVSLLTDTIFPHTHREELTLTLSHTIQSWHLYGWMGIVIWVLLGFLYLDVGYYTGCWGGVPL